MTVQRIHRCFRLHRYSTANAGGGVSDTTDLYIGQHLWLVGLHIMIDSPELWLERGYKNSVLRTNTR